MGRTAFVGWLFTMAIASFTVAASGKSWGWALGGIVFMAVALYARRQLNEEQDDEQPANASFRFVAVGILVMLACMGFLFWLQKSA